MALILLFAAAIFLLLGIILLRYGRRSRLHTGLPQGEVVYSDTGAWARVEKPLLSRRYGLVGKPDYLVQVREKRKQMTIPVEVKSRGRPPAPLDGHILQLGAYCLLVEDTFKQRPPYGLLHYSDATFKIPYNENLRRQVLSVAKEIRRARTMPDVPRQHDEPRRCQGCGYRHGCGAESMVRD